LPRKVALINFNSLRKDEAHGVAAIVKVGQEKSAQARSGQTSAHETGSREEREKSRAGAEAGRAIPSAKAVFAPRRFPRAATSDPCAPRDGLDL
jgi:hypothetical protein